MFDNLFRHLGSVALALGVAAGTAVAQDFAAPAAFPQASAQYSTAATGRLTDESLGELLRSVGLTPKQVDFRHDFRFQADFEGQAWNLRMTAALSRDGESLWLMAWLDELPASAADVPRTALLKMLAANDDLGGNTFYAFLPASRRFVLQRVVPNRNLDAASLIAGLSDLGATVRAQQPIWSTGGWKPVESAGERPVPLPAEPAAMSGPPAALRHAGNEPNYGGRVVR